MTPNSVDFYQHQENQQKQFDIPQSLTVHIRENAMISHFLSKCIISWRTLCRNYRRPIQ